MSKETFELHDDVVVPDPYEEDLWEHSFMGHIVAFKDDTDGTPLATVEDQDGDCWDVEVCRLTHDCE